MQSRMSIDTLSEFHKHPSYIEKLGLDFARERKKNKNKKKHQEKNQQKKNKGNKYLKLTNSRSKINGTRFDANDSNIIFKKGNKELTVITYP